MKQIINSYTYPDWPNIEIEFEKSIELFIDGFDGYNPNSNSYKILLVKEVEAISGFKSTAIEHASKFDLVLTYDEEIIQKCDNARFFPFGTTWIKNYDFLKEKKFQISHLTGHKQITNWHILRQKIHYKQELIVTPRDFYISQYGGVENAFNNKILGEFKEPLFESQFHICIENSDQKNLFTEKTIDCLITKTVPIFCGCDNIGDFFNEKGFIIAKNVNDIIKECNNLTPNTYETMMEAIDENYNICLKYADSVGNLKNTLLDIFKNK